MQNLAQSIFGFYSEFYPKVEISLTSLLPPLICCEKICNVNDLVVFAKLSSHATTIGAK